MLSSNLCWPSAFCVCELTGNIPMIDLSLSRVCVAVYVCVYEWLCSGWVWALELKTRPEHSNCLCLRLIFCSILAKSAQRQAGIVCILCFLLPLFVALLLLLYLFLWLFSTNCRFNCFLSPRFFGAFHCLAIVRFWLGSIVSQFWSLYGFLEVNNEVHGKRSWQLDKKELEISLNY